MVIFYSKYGTFVGLCLTDPPTAIQDCRRKNAGQWDQSLLGMWLLHGGGSFPNGGGIHQTKGHLVWGWSVEPTAFPIFDLLKVPQQHPFLWLLVHIVSPLL